MSYEKQPDPVLPNYNPSAWDTPLSAEEQEILNAYYVKFPTAQNAPITFPSNITTNGTLNAGTISSTTDTVTIGTGKNINLGVAQPNNGYLSMGSGTHGSNVDMNLGSESLNYVYFRSRNIQLNGSATSGNITLGGTANAGTITVNKPLTIGYAPSALTANTMIGGRITSFPSSALAVNQSVGSQIITSFTLPVGVWICSFQIQYESSISTTFTSTSSYMYVSTPTAGESLIYGSNRNIVAQTITPANVLILSGAGTIANTTSQLLYLVDESRYTTSSGTIAVNNPSTYLIATRIG